MKINLGTQKAILHMLFFEEVTKNEQGQPVFRPKQFPLNKLFDAASAAKKLMEDSTEKDGRIWFKDKEVEFTPAEITVLKELFDDNSEKWDITTAEIVKELQELFKGKEK